MPEPTFLLRAWANDPLMSLSLLPPKSLLDQKKLELGTSKSQPSLSPRHSRAGESSQALQVQLEDTNKPIIPVPPLEQELSDSDLPTSVVEEIEVSC